LTALLFAILVAFYSKGTAEAAKYFASYSIFVSFRGCSELDMLCIYLTLALILNFGECSIYIRVNQVGYLPEDSKIGTLMSTDSLGTIQFHVKDFATNAAVFSENIGQSSGIRVNFILQCIGLMKYSRIMGFI
jgi:hypothetical protein